ncbi:MAG: integrin alpha [Candidatus Midichloria sp.]|nr:integrin alpha [Candidatus Midichloria sp.]
MILWLGMYVIFGQSSFNSSLEVSIFIGAPYAFPNGRREAGQAYVVFGRPSFTSPLALSSLDGNNGSFNGIAHDSAGKLVSAAGDINKDGFDDIIVAAPYADPNDRTGAGEVCVIFVVSHLL